MRNKNDGSATVAPKERINIKYVPATGDNSSEVELPLTLLVAGNMKGCTQEKPIEERHAISIDKNNFSSVMRDLNLELNFSIPNYLDDKEYDLPVSIKIQSLDDFSPDQLALQIPQLRKLLELREALVALKGPLGNIPAFRTRLQQMLSSDSIRDQLLKELDLIKFAD